MSLPRSLVHLSCTLWLERTAQLKWTLSWCDLTCSCLFPRPLLLQPFAKMKRNPGQMQAGNRDKMCSRQGLSLTRRCPHKECTSMWNLRKEILFKKGLRPRGVFSTFLLPSVPPIYLQGSCARRATGRLLLRTAEAHREAARNPDG